MKSKKTNTIYLRTGVDFTRPPKREPFYQKFTAWITGSRATDAANLAETHATRWRSEQ